VPEYAHAGAAKRRTGFHQREARGVYPRSPG
jgi:hypothetical protein